MMGRGLWYKILINILNVNLIIMAKTEKCRHYGPNGCLAPNREDCPKKRLPRNQTIFCHHVPVKAWISNAITVIPKIHASLRFPRGSVRAMNAIAWPGARWRIKWTINHRESNPGPGGYAYAHHARRKRIKKVVRDARRTDLYHAPEHDNRTNRGCELPVWLDPYL